MIPIDATFQEATAEPKLESVALSHLSLELGHLYLEDFAAGPDALGEQLRHVARWAGPASGGPGLPDRARVSTCFLVDDYFTPFATPAEVLPMLLRAAETAGLRIDYLAREAACADAGGTPLAALVAARLTAVPPVGTNGSRPPVSEVGWLSNGERSPVTRGEAMRQAAWAPPTEIDARNHSVFVDVELWTEATGERTWSCAFLAAVWQLLRLGVVRDRGANVVRPRLWEGDFPDRWADLPPVIQVNPAAKPFCAYRTFSVLPSRFLQVETAVRVVLSQVAVDPAVLDQISRRARAEDFRFSPELVDRVGYVFFNG